MATGTGNLPNQNMSFSPFAILTAEEMNDLVENIESLADASGIGDGAIDTTQLADGAVTNAKLGDSGWVNLALSVGFTGTARYRKIGNRVQLSGVVTRTAGSWPASNTTFATIPAGARPMNDIDTTAGAYASGTIRTAWVGVRTDGTLLGYSSGAAAATDIIGLDHISYLVD